MKKGILPMSKKTIIAACMLSLAASAFALDFSLRPGGFVFFPAGPGNKAADGNERFDIGGGGELGFDIDLASLRPNTLGLGYTAGIEGGLFYNPYKQPATGNVQIYSFGGALGLYYFPLSRLFTRADGGIGVYQGVIEEGKGKPSLWWRAGGELGFRFTPMFTLSASGGWRQYHSGNGGGAFNSGIYTGLSLLITFETGRNSNAGGVNAALVQDDGIYPAFLSLYQKSPAGTITIRNNENAEIRNVRVSFRAAGYTASEFPCGTLPLVARGRSAELPLYADFSPDVLRFTDTGRILGEVVIRYRFLGTERQSVQTAAVRVFNRNTFPSGDPAGLAAFVSPSSPEILEYAKHIAGLERSNQRTGLNRNMQAALWLFEGLRAAGIRLASSAEPRSGEGSPPVPSAEPRSGEGSPPDDTSTGNDEVQFPAETLGFRTGNRRDTGLLYAAALEAAGIPAALIPLDDDFIIACNLGVNQAAAELLFNSLEKVLVIDGGVWMPLSMNAFNDGFIAAWDGGAEALNEFFTGGAEADFIMLESAWGTYPPAPLPAQGVTVVRVGEGNLAQTADRIIQQYIVREIQPLVEAVQQQIAAVPTASLLPPAGLYNRLGILLVRSGQTAEAKAAYERAAGMGSVPAMTNRGNLALIEKDYAAAEKWFTRALEREPENAAAKRGMEQVGERGE
jgi:tetratricopeptide (TPR) repeat protein